jgi:1-acyl-sn-glycerol-3-phosphate acyltransferase
MKYHPAEARTMVPVAGLSFPPAPPAPTRDAERAPSALRGIGRISRGAIQILDAVGRLRSSAPADPIARRHAAAAAMSKLAADLCATHGLRIERSGPLPRGPAIVVANHLSYIDPLVIASLVPCAAVAKSEVADWPFIGPQLRMFGNLFVARESVHSGAIVLRRALRLLAGGVSILNFPEGTTGGGEALLPFRRGIFGLAQLASVPIVPVALRFDPPDLAWVGDALFLPHYWRVVEKASARVRVELGAPIAPDEAATPEALARRCHDRIGQLLSNLQ